MENREGARTVAASSWARASSGSASAPGQLTRAATHQARASSGCRVHHLRHLLVRIGAVGVRR